MSDAALCLDPAPLVLNVGHSAGGRRWVWRDAALAEDGLRHSLAIAQRAGIPELLGRILAARGVALGRAEAFLDPRLRDWLPDPSCLKDMEAAAARLSRAVRERECIGVFGDYDVDGACGTALLTDLLRELGCAVETHIPDRQKEGYGPNAAALDGLMARGAQLLVCVDCGTAAAPILDPFAGRVDLIVLDHHKPDGGVLPRGIVVNPNRLDCTSQLGTLCATAVAFLTGVALLRDLRAQGWFTEHPEPNLLRRLDLVALATICDVMPLQGLNRALVAQGLRVLGRGERLGLATLASVAMVKESASAMACGFAFGPRINAGGRIAQADLGLKLLLADDAFEARTLAEKLDEVNRQRQTVEADILTSALQQAQTQVDAGHAVLFLRGDAWHPGVVGIVAGRVRERFNRPALVGALQDGVIKGSARSVPGLDLGAAVIAARQAGLLLTGGGHAMAAGFSLAAGQADSFHHFLDERLSAARERPAQDDLLLDGVLSLRGATSEVAAQIGRLAPFGMGNEEPLLAISRVRCVKVERIGRDGNTLRAILQGEDGGRLRGLVFRAADKPFADVLEDSSAPLLHVAGHLRSERWQDRETLTLFIADIALI
ncbi:single-stranded-DNA-specific exonuclease RecJ [Neoasaia chiangmaiensis NBRC 101099]|uniref:Single-stranded-DNA-specific exonuclease RecJ n=1 Tax=Neoasaia chiangmaiensis TaxID=320497 RepID=A0A1U9KR41_9PROT|nr:single-stranded-DNA-specific exonuclease RecJ [Neoasaia chiangmaiensis]AQS88200.1 single-stranded-DNA-specific exonuclease RecJ [Neoasaia chiangmaiensis]GBR39876.1 single-stranded-DNA-specific exonuclease RecJ [Neoasaia chiangmaiensis NBRC 101099]GEN14782.1 single-stranded-DNA-specific exonuclease RecJ [Neoasaia chiangmaiensis]